MTLRHASLAVIILLCAGCSAKQLSNGGNVLSPDVSEVVPQVDTTSLLPRNIPYAGSIIPETTVSVGPTVSKSLEKLVWWGMYAAAAYSVLDPLAPNWSLEEARFPEDHYRLSLEMKRYYTGGAGEARQVFHRRAKDLMRAGGFDSYQVVEYTEGMESSVLGSKRVAEGVIKLVARQPG